MSTTLTNGLKLPDKGSVDWYADMQSNYAILDGAVGTVAEHTTQIAGKAPAVHTHTKSDITDFPAYGNAAGTICEGNDSRLSDARTPVAHTHGKADITDLFNSANTWSDNQIIASSNDKCYYVKDTVYELGQDYSNGEHLGGLTIYDKNGATVGLLDIADRSYGNTEMRIRVQQKFDPDSNNRSTSGTTIFHEILVGIGPSKETYVTLNGSLRAGTNNAYDLGTSAKQWNNLYAKNYYYNGVAWGLDKANEWTGNNTFSAPCKTLGKKLLTDITDLDDAYYNGEVCGFNPNTLHNPTGGYGDVLTINNAVNIPDNVYSSWITQIATNAGGGYLGIRNRSNGGAWTSWTRILTEDHAVPTVTNTYDLGTSTHKWKSLNGVNPGALSLPGAYQGINDQIKNPSDQLNAIDLNGGSNTWVSDVDCYLYFYIPNNKFTWIRIFWPATLVRCGQTFVPVPNESSDYSGFVPVPANTTVVIQIKGTQAPIFRRSACLGNV